MSLLPEFFQKYTAIEYSGRERKIAVRRYSISSNCVESSLLHLRFIGTSLPTVDETLSLQFQQKSRVYVDSSSSAAIVVTGERVIACRRGAREQRALCFPHLIFFGQGFWRSILKYKICIYNGFEIHKICRYNRIVRARMLMLFSHWARVLVVVVRVDVCETVRHIAAHTFVLTTFTPTPSWVYV